MASKGPNVPVVDYPVAAVILDTVLLERASAKLGNYDPIEPGAPFRKASHSADQVARMEGNEFLGQKASEDDEWMRQYWGRPPSTQDVYNWDEGYSAEDNAFPIFARRYLIKRDDYEATRPAKLTPLAGLFRVRITAAGTGFTSAPVITFTGGTGSGATAIAVLSNSGGIAKITLKTEGAYTVVPTVVITGGGGAGATATASLQPLTCVLVEEKTSAAQFPFDSLYLVAARVFETLPGPWIPFTRYDDNLGPIQGRRRAVINTGQGASLTATAKTTYEGRDGSSIVSWQLEETYSNGTGSDSSNPVFPFNVQDGHDNERGAFQIVTQLVVQTGAEQGSLDVIANGVFARTITNSGSGYTSAPLVAFTGGGGSGASAVTHINAAGQVSALIITDPGSGYTSAPTVSFSGGAGTGAAATVTTAALLAKEITYDPFNEFLLKKIVETWAIPAVPLPSEELNEDGTVTTRTQTMELRTAITEGETLGGGVWTKTSSRAITATISWKIVEARAVPGNTRREDRWDEENRVLISNWSKLEDVITVPPAVGSTGGSYNGSVIRHNAIASLSVIDPGYDYISLPTLTVVASPGGGAQATGTVASLKAVTATIANVGSGYALGDTITFTGGTFSTAAIATVSLATLATLALNAPGSGYAKDDIITLQGGVAPSPATVTVATTRLVSTTLNAAGTGMVPAAVLTLVGGTASTSAQVTITTTKLVSATIATAGTGGANGAQTATGTTGTGTKFQIAVTVSGGAITAIGAISVTGSYTVNPTNIASEPVSVTGGGLTDARLNVVMGVETFSISNAGVFTVNSATFTSTGGGNNATFQSSLFGVNTFTISSGGSYSTSATSFSQASTTGSGLGATFQTVTFTISGLTISNGGVYTVIPGSPTAQGSTSGSGTGLTAVLSFGIGTVTLTNAGTGYYTEFPTVTLSYGTGRVVAISDALAVATGIAGYVHTHAMLNVDQSALVKLMTWTTSPVPPQRKSNPSVPFEFPAIFIVLQNSFVGSTPRPGYTFTLLEHRRARFAARETIEFGLAQFTDLPTVFTMSSPAAASKIFRIPNNTVHAVFSWFLYDGNGIITYAERFAASTPYSRGQTVVVRASQEPWRGEAMWKKTVIEIKEDGPLY